MAKQTIELGEVHLVFNDNYDEGGVEHRTSVDGDPEKVVFMVVREMFRDEVLLDLIVSIKDMYDIMKPMPEEIRDALLKHTRPGESIIESLIIE